MITLSNTEMWPNGDDAPTLEDIGIGLGRLPRFAGQTRRWYSVLCHVHVVAMLVEPRYQLHALMHDAAECVTGDIPSPWKTRHDHEREQAILERIYKMHRFPVPDVAALNAVRAADTAALVAEARILQHARPVWFTSRYANGQLGVEPDPGLLERAESLTRREVEYAGWTLEPTRSGPIFACWVDYAIGARAAA